MWARKGEALEPDFEDPEFLRCATVAISRLDLHLNYWYYYSPKY